MIKDKGLSTKQILTMYFNHKGLTDRYIWYLSAWSTCALWNAVYYLFDRISTGH
ncbi:MAG: hypothetical protein ACRKGH_08765 [Dehalogenimonas sp.]